MLKGKCCVPSCEQKAHARGYCRKHYGRMWRGKELEPTKEEDTRVHSADDAEKELMEMRRIYDHVVGFESRMRWSRKIRECELFVRREQERAGARMTMSATG